MTYTAQSEANIGLIDLNSRVKTGNVSRIRASSNFGEMGSPFLITEVGACERYFGV